MINKGRNLTEGSILQNLMLFAFPMMAGKSFLSESVLPFFIIFLHIYCVQSEIPLYFLAISSVMNIVLGLYFVISLQWGVSGVAAS